MGGDQTERDCTESVEELDKEGHFIEFVELDFFFTSTLDKGFQIFKHGELYYLKWHL